MLGQPSISLHLFARHSPGFRSKSATIPEACQFETKRINQYESGARALTIDEAQKICNEYGVTLDWLFRGDRSMLPHRLAIKIQRIEAAERKC